MSDDLVNEHAHRSIQHEGETYISRLDAGITFAFYRTHINHQAAEIASLRAELATARREGMEEAARIADATAHANRVEYPEKWKDRPEGIPHDWSVSWETCAETAEEIAAAIRAAAGEGK